MGLKEEGSKRCLRSQLMLLQNFGFCLGNSGELANEAKVDRKFKGRKRVLCEAFAVFIIWIVIGL